MAFTIDPEDAALLVIDMQNGMVHDQGTLARSGVPMAGLQRVVPNVRELVRLCRSLGIPDLWTMQEHYQRDKSRDAHLIQHHTLRRVNIACLKGSWDAEILDELKAEMTEASQVIRKQKWSAFYGTNLEILLRILGRRLLLIAGTTSNLCIETTIRDAYMRDYDLVIVEDCVAGVRQEWHDAAVATWKYYMGMVVPLDELRTMLPQPAAVPHG